MKREIKREMKRKTQAIELQSSGINKYLSIFESESFSSFLLLIVFASAESSAFAVGLLLWSNYTNSSNLHDQFQRFWLSAGKFHRLSPVAFSALSRVVLKGGKR